MVLALGIKVWENLYILFKEMLMVKSQKYKKFFDLNKIIKDIKSYQPQFDKKLFLEAFAFTENAHSGQMRKDEKTPYLVHPIETVKTLVKLKADQDVLIAALLHDVPEDTKYDIKQVKTNFGDKVAFLVDGITKLSKVQYKHNMPERQIESLRKLLLHSAKDLRVILIKLADRLHNIRTLEYVAPEKRSRIAHETLEIYVPMANLLGLHYIKTRLETACFEHLFPTEYKKVKSGVEKVHKKYEKNAEIFIKTINDICQKNKIKIDIFRKKKTLYREYKRLCADGRSINEPRQTISIGIKVKNSSQCYHVLGLIHSLFVPTPAKFKDYIAHPKVNGYQALHTKIFGIRGIVTEVYIQSERMYKEGEFGVANYFQRKKPKGAASIWTGKKYSWFKKILEIEDGKKISDDFLEELKGDILQDRILAFTPKGRTIDLPEGASAIDFAYAIHTAVGNHADKVRINGKVRPIITVLKTGDVIDVVTSIKASPQLYWLSFIKTNNAKTKVLHYLREINQKDKIKEGLKLLQKDLDIWGMGFYKKYSFKNVKKILSRNFGKTLHNWNEVGIAICEGRLNAIDIVKSIKNPTKKSRLVKKGMIKCNIRIEAKNRVGLLGEISKIIYKYVVDITSTKGVTSSSLGHATFKMTILVEDFADIDHMFDELEQMEDVEAVYNIPHKDLIWFYGVATSTVVLWLAHPIILFFVTNSNLNEKSHAVSESIIFAGLAMLMLMLLYLKVLIKKFFPLLRGKKRLWGMSFIVLTFSVLMIIWELSYFKIGFSWVAALVITLLMYAYLILSYLDFRRAKL